MGTSNDAIGSAADDWERWAELDGRWAILTTRSVGGDPVRWDDRSFFETGELEIRRMLQYLRQFGYDLPSNARCLDFGCGHARLTRAIARRTAFCLGIDASFRMLTDARNGLAGEPVYLINTRSVSLPVRESSIDFVYSNIALQHTPQSAIGAYVSSLARTLAPEGWMVINLPELQANGDIVVQPSYSVLLRLRQMLALRTRMRNLGRRPSSRPGPTMLMSHLDRGVVVRILEDAGLEVVDVAFTNSASSHFGGNISFADSAEAVGGAVDGLVGLQYVARRS